MLPDFRLETYLGKWEFACRYHMTASDMQTLSLKELLALATPEDRAAWEDLPLHLYRAHGHPCPARGHRRHLSRRDAGRHPGLCRCRGRHLLRDACAAGQGRSRHRRDAQLPVRARNCRGRSVRDDGVALDPDDAIGSSTSTSCRAAIRPNTKLIADQLPAQPDRQGDRPRDLRRAGGAVPPARHLAVLRRGLSRAGTPGRNCACRPPSRPMRRA